MYPFKIGKTYTFNSLAPALLQAVFSNAKMLGSMDYESARSFANIDLLYRSIYPLLPQGTPDQVEACEYYRFLTESGEKVVLADQWIDSNSVEVIEHINFQVLFSQASISDISRVRDVLNSLGYTNYEIKQI